MKQYLGDSVYAEYDGMRVILTTENGAEPTNRIVLEPELLIELTRFYERAVAQWIQSHDTLR